MGCSNFKHGCATASDVTPKLINTDIKNRVAITFLFSSTFIFVCWLVFQVTGLEEGVNYEFRVRGVNNAGVGMASMPSDPMTAKALAGIV